MQNFRTIRPLFMERLHFKDLGDTSVVSKCSLGVNLVINNCFFIGPLEILHFENVGDTSVVRLRTQLF